MKLADWSRLVKGRDGKCMHCGSTDDLHAHHVLPKSTHPELRCDVDNGITLCYRCHKAEHERNRHLLLSGPRKPQRKTLERKIAELEREKAELEARIVELTMAPQQAAAIEQIVIKQPRNDRDPERAQYWYNVGYAAGQLAADMKSHLKSDPISHT